ncbi:hypothetical protein BDZ89DRAFT_958068, partial [Hymenopellis radicata]
GAVVISAPVTHCPRCPKYRLVHHKNRPVEGQLFTRARGILPVYTVSKYCIECSTYYHPGYWVQNADHPDSMRHYYAGIPDYIQASETHWVERDLAAHWSLQMAVQHASANDIENVYNLELKEQPWHGLTNLVWRLNRELVMDTFWIFALLRDQARRTNGTGTLAVANQGDQVDRFKTAIDNRNLAMTGTGQPMWGHICDACVKLKPDPTSGALNALVLDGVSVRCRCCSVSADEEGMPCIEPLMHPKDKFCGIHSRNAWRCFVRECVNDRGENSRACADPVHQALEREEIAIQGQGTRELHRRARRLGLREETTNDLSANGPMPPFATKKQAKKRRKRLLTSKYTHCEMLAVRPCGIIIGRTTLFGAEGIKAVVTFLKSLFPTRFAQAMPAAFFYDKACHLLEHLIKSGDSYLTANSLHLYDIFHGAFCHKEGDSFCNQHCNPALHNDVLDAEGRVIFNTSACEQANVWFGGFTTVAREMTFAHFMFFADEMILIHNELVDMNLRRKGLHPMILPLAHWDGTWAGAT